MSTSSSNSDSVNERLIHDLAADLVPVRRLRPPSVRALTWLAVVAAIAIMLAVVGDLSALGHRLRAAPDMWLSVTGSTLTVETMPGAVVLSFGGVFEAPSVICVIVTTRLASVGLSLVLL